jgi:hypothetical protein
VLDVVVMVSVTEHEGDAEQLPGLNDPLEPLGKPLTAENPTVPEPLDAVAVIVEVVDAP